MSNISKKLGNALTFDFEELVNLLIEDPLWVFYSFIEEFHKKFPLQEDLFMNFKCYLLGFEVPDKSFLGSMTSLPDKVREYLEFLITALDVSYKKLRGPDIEEKTGCNEPFIFYENGVQVSEDDLTLSLEGSSTVTTSCLGSNPYPNSIKDWAFNTTQLLMIVGDFLSPKEELYHEILFVRDTRAIQIENDFRIENHFSSSSLDKLRARLTMRGELKQIEDYANKKAS